jgi:hypothetical protein
MRFPSLRLTVLIGLLGMALLAIVCTRPRVEPIHVDRKQESQVIHFPVRKPPVPRSTRVPPPARPKFTPTKGITKPSGPWKGARP